MTTAQEARAYLQPAIDYYTARLRKHMYWARVEREGKGDSWALRLCLHHARKNSDTIRYLKRELRRLTAA